jgi:hypothetical protein
MTEISRAMSDYRDLEKRLLALRIRTNGKYSHEEPAITDSMAAVWEELSVEEQDQVYAEGEKVPMPTDGPSFVRIRGTQNPSVWIAVHSITQWEVRLVSRPRAGEHFAAQVVSRGLERWFDPISRDALNVREALCT